MKVVMLKITNYNGLKKEGETHDLPEDVALRWINRGIAKPSEEVIVEEEIKEEEETEVDDNGSISSVCNDSRPGGLSGDSSGKSAYRQHKAFKKGK